MPLIQVGLHSISRQGRILEILRVQIPQMNASVIQYADARA